ncbi:MAG: hypothetical protein EBY45_09720, partial [Gammaproteobacteria bacterium]|nr:hypothetical protein [Gammaproteobacteria bacterium]
PQVAMAPLVVMAPRAAMGRVRKSQPMGIAQVMTPVLQIVIPIRILILGTYLKERSTTGFVID